MNMAVGQNTWPLAIFHDLFGDDTMPQSLSQLYVHLIFSTKDRFPFLKDDIAFRVHGYLATVVRDMGSEGMKGEGIGTRSRGISMCACKIEYSVRASVRRYLLTGGS